MAGDMQGDEQNPDVQKAHKDHYVIFPRYAFRSNGEFR